MKKILKITLLFIITYLLFNISSLHAATTTVSYVWTATDLWWWDYSWTNLNNIIGNNTNTSATVTFNSKDTFSNYISLTNFDLASAWLPVYSTIDWITVNLEVLASWNRVTASNVQLTLDWTTWIWNNNWSNSSLTRTKGIETYWSSTDLWWRSWTSSELLSSNFWVYLQFQSWVPQSRTLDIYRVYITIDYTEIINNPPTDITLSNNNIEENQSTWTLIWDLTTTDLDTSDTHTYTFWCTTPWADDSSFSISWDNLLSDEVFDYDVKNTYNICIKTDDWNWWTFDKNFTINITEEFINSVPTDITLSNDYIFEKLAVLNLIGTLGTIDADITDTHTYSLDCSTPWNNDENFSISWDTLLSNRVFTNGVEQTQDICIKTDDWNWWIYEENFMINIVYLDFENPWWYTVTSWIWDRNTNEAYSWSYSIESWNHSDGSISCFEADRTLLHDVTISFYTKISTEENNDFLYFYINWVEQDSWSWELPWTQHSYNLDAWIYNFEWCYEKDFDTTVWDDTVRIDEIDIERQLLQWIERMSFWLRADKGTSTTISWNSLNTWEDFAINYTWTWIDATAWVAPTYLYDDTNHLNFNPIIDFDWSTQYLENLDNWANSHTYYMVIIPDNDINWTSNSQVPFWLDCEDWILNRWTCWLQYAWLSLWEFSVALNDEVITYAIWSSDNYRSSQVWAFSYDANQPMIIWVNENIEKNRADIFEKWKIVSNLKINEYQTISNTDYSIGRSLDSGYYNYFDWKIAEIINYNYSFSELDKQKMDSYLGIKYGVTINDWDFNYVWSDWTTSMWSKTLAWEYNSNIFGIARDNLSYLSQIKSKSTNITSVVTIEAVWEWTNISPSFVDMDDMEYLTISNNNGWNFWSTTDSPTWYNILTRKWKVQETWEVGTIDLSFDVWNTNYDIPATSSGVTYYFIYDSDDDESLADETPSAMTDEWSNIWSFTWVNLNHLQIFTIATVASTNNIPTNIILSSNNVDENVSSWTTVWSLSTSDLDTWDSHTYSLVSWVWDTDNSFFSINSNNLIINDVPDYWFKNEYYIRIQTDDWNWWLFQKEFTIFINNVVEITNSIINFENLSDENKYNVNSWIWTRTTNNAYTWSYSLESDNWWAANTQSCFQIEYTFTTIWDISFYYNVSSEENNDYLKFYIDNVEESSWSGNVGWTKYEKTDIEIWTYVYKWCYIKNWSINAWSDTAWIDYITFDYYKSDNLPPNITDINYSSWTILPWWNHNLIINYYDNNSWIDLNSDDISLYKWDWVSSWWTDISSTWLNLWSKTITTTSATYPTNDLSFWKYKYNFEISDNSWNSTSTWITFYIDETEFIISTWTIDIWELETDSVIFSQSFNITVKTVWAWFSVLWLSRSLFEYEWVEITQRNWDFWFWYIKEGYGSELSTKDVPVTIITKDKNININWLKNIYNFTLKLWAQVSEEQAAWEYEMNLNFWVDFNY